MFSELSEIILKIHYRRSVVLDSRFNAAYVFNYDGFIVRFYGLFGS